MPSQFKTAGLWAIRVTVGSGESTQSSVLDVPPNEPIEVVDEVYPTLPVFDQSAFGWLKGQRLGGVSAQEGVVSGALVAESVEVRLSGDEEGEPLVAGVDYLIDPFWGTIGRLLGGRLGESDSVTIRYRYVSPRLDAVILQADGQIVLRLGTPSNVSPVSPAPEAGEKLLGRVFLTRDADGLSPSDLFPVESSDPLSVVIGRKDTVASRMPKIWRKLLNGEELRILAWGDSVTDGQYMDDPDNERWQDQFVMLLKARFPQANVKLVTEAWPGHGSADYLNAVMGDPKRFETSVISQKPDLVISEFVNDAFLASPGVTRQYGQIRSAFKKAGIEWIVMTPHFTHPQFMGFESVSEAVTDNRAYVSALRRFGIENRVLVADASAQWADLKRQGMPYMALLSNGINHPNANGQRLFANALLAYF